jgi:hypothetical protein
LIRGARAAASINCTAREAAFVVAAPFWKKMTKARNAAAAAGKVKNIRPAGKKIRKILKYINLNIKMTDRRELKSAKRSYASKYL